MPSPGADKRRWVRRCDLRNYGGNEMVEVTPVDDQERLREALERIARLQAKWGAPTWQLRSDEHGEKAWAAVGSEASRIARAALSPDREAR